MSYPLEEIYLNLVRCECNPNNTKGCPEKTREMIFNSIYDIIEGLDINNPNNMAFKIMHYATPLLVLDEISQYKKQVLDDRQKHILAVYFYKLMVARLVTNEYNNGNEVYLAIAFTVVCRLYKDRFDAILKVMPDLKYVHIGYMISAMEANQDELYKIMSINRILFYPDVYNYHSIEFNSTQQIINFYALVSTNISLLFNAFMNDCSYKRHTTNKLIQTPDYTMMHNCIDAILYIMENTLSEQDIITVFHKYYEFYRLYNKDRGKIRDDTKTRIIKELLKDNYPRVDYVVRLLAHNEGIYLW